MLVLQITPSNSMNMAGSTKMTTVILIRAPLDKRVHMELIISTLE